MANDVFISHSHKDKDVADKVCHYLESRNIRCWIAPRDIPAGESWAGAIVKAISESKLLILILSSRSNDSEEIHQEASVAGDEKVPILPFLIEDIKPSQDLRYYLSRRQWLDATASPLESHFEVLLGAVITRLSDSLNVKAEPESLALDFSGDEYLPSRLPPSGESQQAYFSRFQKVLLSASIAILAIIFLTAIVWVVKPFSPGLSSLYTGKFEDEKWINTNSFGVSDTVLAIADVSNNSGDLRVHFYLTKEGDVSNSIVKNTPAMVEVSKDRDEARYTLTVDSELDVGKYVVNADMWSKSSGFVSRRTTRITIATQGNSP